MKRALMPIAKLWCLAYYRTALKQLSKRDPCHEDVPHLVRLINQWESQ